MTTGSDPRAAEKAALLERYDNQIDWYWTNSGRQKKRFIYTRFTILVLGALVTLIASLAAATFVEDNDVWDTIFKILTPVLAAVLAVITGLTQTFQWGAAWREMNLAAMALEKERDRIRLTPAYKVDAVAEIERFNDLVIDETRRYFERVTAAARSDEVEAQVRAAAEAAVAAVMATRPRDVNLAPAAAAPAPAGGEYSDAQYDVGPTEEPYASPATATAYEDDTAVSEPDLVGGPVADDGGEGGSPFAAEGEGGEYDEGEGGSPFAAEGEGGEYDEEGGGSPFAAEGEGDEEGASPFAAGDEGEEEGGSPFAAGDEDGEEELP